MAAETASEGATVAREYIEAVVRGDIDAVAERLHPEMAFSAGGRSLDRDGYLQALRRLTLILERNEISRTIADGDDVCVVYDFVTDTPAGAVPSVEWLTLDAGRIKSVRLIFERERWPEVLAELERRAAVG
jgi:hypothetical protein